MEHQVIVFLANFTLLALLHFGMARDLRHVTEPKTPQICTTLKGTGEVETETIQKALDSCAKGKAVQLSSGTFLSGPLKIPSGVSLLVDRGAKLSALTTAALYDRGSKTCGTINNSGGGCKPFITIEGATGSGIYGLGTIDGRGGTSMTGTNITWWHLARNALALHKQQNNPMLIQIIDSVDITLYQITLINSPMFHVQSRNTSGFTVWGITINTPSYALNSDGVDPTGSTNVTIAYCNISTGDDNIAISSLHSHSRYISVYNNYFGHGNSMAIGSGVIYGVSDVTISNMTLKNMNYGLYIKSNTLNGGVVTKITYNNICIYKALYPISLDTRYYYKKGNNTPDFHEISFNNVNVLTNGTFVFHGVSKSVPIEATLKNVHIAKHSKWSVSNAMLDGSWDEEHDVDYCGDYGNEVN